MHLRSELVTAAAYDQEGVLTDVSVTALAHGEAKGAITALFGGGGAPALMLDTEGRLGLSVVVVAPSWPRTSLTRH